MHNSEFNTTLSVILTPSTYPELCTPHRVQKFFYTIYIIAQIDIYFILLIWGLLINITLLILINIYYVLFL